VAASPQVRVAILGGGMSGLCMGIRLKQRGLDSFLILEKAARVGGTWRENTYPGVACDVPSHLYSFSFELNPDWSRVFSPGWEIQDYCERCVETYEIGSHLRLGSEVREVRFEEGRWRVETADGFTLYADCVVSALGGLHRPNRPGFKDRGAFRGRFFHSAEWDHACDLRGQRVGVIGSGASAIQIVPSIAGQAARVAQFQRTPGWIVPRFDRAIPQGLRRRFHRHPWLLLLQRALLYSLLEARGRFIVKGSWMNRLIQKQARAHLAKQVHDADLRRQLTPIYPIGCKRVLVSDDYYAALGRDDVELVTSAIERFEPEGVRTADGTLHPLDVVVAATGFRPFDISDNVGVWGREGGTLRDAWRDRIEAHRTVMMPGFPNFFLLLGPNSGLGHNSVILMIEAQVNYVLRCLDLLENRGLRWMAPHPDAATTYNRSLQRGMLRTAFSGGCAAWYTDDHDRNFTLWPWSTMRYFWTMRRPNPREFELEAGGP
jgi:cation diffusion facilitator CzcD-associated flavoprotein CzcO